MPWDTTCLTPVKLAHFYTLVGGDYDSFFLETAPTSLSFIYQSLGCFHTLLPSQDPYTAPSIPALTPQGFTRWQTVQLLLSPEKHAPFLQEAVKRFDLVNPSDGEPFPSVLPRNVLPSKPDREMTEWHEAVSEKLMLEAQASHGRNLPPRPPMALSDSDLDSSRPTSADSYSIESQSIVDAASYFHQPRTYTYNHHPPPPSFINVPLTTRQPPETAYEGPWSPLRRRSSLPGQRPPATPVTPWPRSTHAQFTYSSPLSSPPQHNQARARARTPSTLSTSSCTSSSSSGTTSSASLSPVRYQTRLPHGSHAQAERRNSMGKGVPLYRPASHPTPLYRSHPRQPASMGPTPNAKGLNVRWHDRGQRSGWTAQMQGRGWSFPGQTGHKMARPQLNRARSMDKRSFGRRFARQEEEERDRWWEYCFPRVSRTRR